jgi:hypothetical protein
VRIVAGDGRSVSTTAVGESPTIGSCVVMRPLRCYSVAAGFTADRAMPELITVYLARIGLPDSRSTASPVPSR